MEGALLSINNTLKEKEGLLLWKVPSPLHTLSELNCFCWTKLRLMEEILHQLIRRIHHYLQGFIHPRWCRISSINSMSPNNPLTPNVCCFSAQENNKPMIHKNHPRTIWLCNSGGCLEHPSHEPFITPHHFAKGKSHDHPPTAASCSQDSELRLLQTGELDPKDHIGDLWWVFD